MDCFSCGSRLKCVRRDHSECDGAPTVILNMECVGCGKKKYVEVFDNSEEVDF